MKGIKFLLAAMFGAALIVGCADGSSVSLDPAAQKATIDSLVQAHSQELRDSFDKACADRLETEATAKADSIFKAGEGK